MSWDLFSSAEQVRNEALARTVATRAADAGAADADPGRAGAPPEWSVSAVNAAAREMVEGVFPPVRVVGEVANFTRARSGHCYFSLRDPSAQLRCVMWSDDARRLPALPSEGMEIRVLGRLTLYEARGEFQLVVSTLDAKGEGLWKLAFDRLRGRLDAEGITAPARKRPLPRVPARVGVVTSTGGAALRDILSVIRRRAPWTEVIVAGCRVQGDGAAQEIAAAIRRFGSARAADVLIVGRGGGSIEDLWAFNEEVVARAIAASPVPTISAVGHETDVTIADLVADLRAATPSAAAEAAVPDGPGLSRHLGLLEQRMRGGLEDRIASARERHARASRALRESAERGLRRRRDRLSGCAEKLQILSPLTALSRGFALPLDADRRLLRTASDLPPGRAFALRLADGTVPCRVTGEPEMETNPGASS